MEQPIKHLLVPTDFSKNADKAIRFATQIAQKSGCTLHILHAFSLLEGTTPERKKMEKAWNENQKNLGKTGLLRLQEEIRTEYPGISTMVHLYAGPSDEVIFNFCNSNQIDLIVMGTQGTSQLAGIFMGSTTNHIIRKISVPVVCVPGDYQPRQMTTLVFASNTFGLEPAILNPVFTLAHLFQVQVEVMYFSDEDDTDKDISEKMNILTNYETAIRKLEPLLQIDAILIEGNDFEDTIQEYCNNNKVGLLCMTTFKRNFFERLLKPSRTKKMAYETKIPLLAIPFPKKNDK